LGQHSFNDRLLVVSCFRRNAHEAPALAFKMSLTLRIVLGAPRQRVNRTIDLHRQPGAAHGKIDRVAADLVLAHHMDARFAQLAQRRPSAYLASAHAGASFGCVRARRMSQAPASIIGIDSSMPIVM